MRENQHPNPRPRDSPGELQRFAPVSDGVVLAAIDRAESHRGGRRDGVIMRRLAEHLGFVHSSWTTRNLKPQLEALIAAGLVLRSRRHGLPMIGLTSNGRKRLTRAHRTGKPLSLPEAPQHREWRRTRAAAAELIGGFREKVRHSLHEAATLLEANEDDADAWFDLSQRLQRQCWQLGSATHCLREWPEPDDARADVDDQRRTTRNWETR